MSEDIVDLLRLRHTDTWPMQIGKGDLINTDGPAAADLIENQNEKLRACIRAIERLEAALRAVIAVSGRDCPEFREAVAALKEKMTDDLVTRLYDRAGPWDSYDRKLYKEAANRIEELERLVKQYNDGMARIRHWVKTGDVLK